MKLSLIAVLLVMCSTTCHGLPLLHAHTNYKSFSRRLSESDSPASQSRIDIAIQTALSMLGWEYSQDPVLRMQEGTCDCSSLVLRAVTKAAPELAAIFPRTTRQYEANAAVQEVPVAEISPGDVMWRDGHVAFFIGNDQYVNAGRPYLSMVKSYSRTGQWTTKVYRPKY